MDDKKFINSDGQQFNHYQQNYLSPEITEHKKEKQHKVMEI